METSYIVWQKTERAIFKTESKTVAEAFVKNALKGGKTSYFIQEPSHTVLVSEEVNFCEHCRAIRPTLDFYTLVDEDGDSDYSHSTCAICHREV